jgi:fructosamine-3-kinase
MSRRTLESRIEAALGVSPRRIGPLSGGCIGDVYAVDFDASDRVVVKHDPSADAKLDIEAFMLRYLADHGDLPVPLVRFAAPDLLILEFINGDSHFNAKAEEHAADLLAGLHECRANEYGLDRDTLIGGLHQPNTRESSWVAFFRDHRIMHMARLAHDERRIDTAMLGRIETFAGTFENLLLEPPYPSLLHGDVWTTNVLALGNRITAFIDPAIYYGHPEIELAFTTLFGTFGDAFFKRYHERRSIADDFFETRRDIYNCYPILVHVRLFGSGYVSGIDKVLTHHGC